MAVDWTTTPVYGTWWNDDGTLKEGSYEVELISRVTNSDADGIFPAQSWKAGELSTTGDQSMLVLCPVSDDTANVPQGFKVMVRVSFKDGSRTEQYVVELPGSLNTLTPPGLNLRSIQLPQDDVQQVGTLIGIPGGVAALDSDGDVVDADGHKVGGGSGAVASVNGKTGTVVLDAGDVGAKADSYVPAWSEVTGKPSIPSTPGDIGAATEGQGAKADTAVQPGDLAAVATSGSYSDLSGQPSIPSTPGDIGAATAAQGALAVSAVQPTEIGTAASHDVDDFATAAQGSLADTAVQPSDLADVATSGSYDDLTDKPASTPTAWDDVTGKPAVIAAGATAAAARTAIGAGTSSFDGAYGSLTGAPAIPDSPDDIGAVPTTRTVNGKALSADVTLSASDVGALPDSTTIPDPTTDASDLTAGTLDAARLPAVSAALIVESGGSYPSPPAGYTSDQLIYVGSTTPPEGALWIEPGT